MSRSEATNHVKMPKSQSSDVKVHDVADVKVKIQAQRAQVKGQFTNCKSNDAKWSFVKIIRGSKYWHFHFLLCCRYIFVSVSTTTFLWLVFLPTYFSAFYSYHQSALLAFCLILNATITLLSLYAPKLYAIYYVDQDMIEFGATQASMSQVTTTTNVVSDGNQDK